jgi:multiple sugar transport system substrate-binding protein
MKLFDRSIQRILLLVASLGLGFTATSCSLFQRTTRSAADFQPAPTTSQRFAGVTLSVVTLDKPIGVGVERRAREFAAMTGAKVNMVTVPFGEVYNTIRQDFTSGRNAYDVLVFVPQWIADYAGPGYLENLTDRVTADSALQWDDVAPFFRNFGATYQEQVYTVPVDGDFHMLYYRTDLLAQAGLEPPSTWDEYLNIAEQFNGKDFNNDGEPDYGSCIPKQANHVGYWMFGSIVSPFLQSQGTQQGAFFDTATMRPLVNNEAFAKALDIYKATGDYGPANELQLDLTGMRNLFMAGRCALAIDWGDTGTLAIAPDSQVVDKVGAAILPGTTTVLDRATGKLVPCDKFTCPYGINGVNHAPYAALGGWVGAINAASPPNEKAAAYALISYISQPAQANTDVTVGITGFNPYRISQFTQRDAWIDAGMSAEAASKYLGGIGVSLNNPNMVLDLRIPQNHRYQREVLDSALSAFLANEITQEQAMQQIEQGWQQLTNQLGPEAQRNAYQAGLGLAQGER